MVDGTYGSITEGFLVKQVRYIAVVDDWDELDQAVIFLAPEGASVTEIAAAFTATLVDPKDSSNAGNQSVKRQRVVWDSIFALPTQGWATLIAGGSNAFALDSGWMKLGGGKGIPFQAGKGPEVVAFNYATTASLAAGVGIQIQTLLRGVWLND